MNSIRRGAPVPVAPVFSTPVIRPKLADGLMVRFDPLPATEPTLAPGVLYSGWFSRLNAAARKFERQVLGDPEPLLQRGIDLVGSRPVGDIPSQIAPRPVGRRGERRRD